MVTVTFHFLWNRSPALPSGKELRSKNSAVRQQCSLPCSPFSPCRTNFEVRQTVVNLQRAQSIAEIAEMLSLLPGPREIISGALKRVRKSDTETHEQFLLPVVRIRRRYTPFDLLTGIASGKVRPLLSLAYEKLRRICRYDLIFCENGTEEMIRFSFIIFMILSFTFK